MIKYNCLPKDYRIAKRYIISSKVGQGHSSSIYKALDLNTNTEVVLKILDPYLSTDPVNIQRFIREVKIIRSLNHPTIIKLYDFIKEDNFYIISMEVFDGLDGKAYLKKYGVLSFSGFLKVAHSILSAIDTCHKNNILHRDIKPQNILINSNFDVKILDFGISKMNTMSDLTRTGTVIGTPAYMAPELFQSIRNADPRSDIYAVGLLFYELLTGTPPYQAQNLTAIMKLHLQGEIERIITFRSDIPQWMEAIIFKCIKTNPTFRYQSIYELIDDLNKQSSSLAAFEAKRESAICLHCKKELISGLNFCHICGTFSRDVFKPGEFSIIIYQCDDLKGIQKFLSRQYPFISKKKIYKALSHLPTVIIEGISKASALIFSNELSVYPCEYDIVDTLPNKLKLPKIFILPIIVLIIFFMTNFLFEINYRWIYIIFFVLCEGVLIYFYKQKSKPLINAQLLKSITIARKINPELLNIVTSLRELSDDNLKSILGHIIVKYLKLKEQIISERVYLDLEKIYKITNTSIKAAKAAEAYQGYLNSTTLNEIKEKMDVVALKIKHTKKTDSTEDLIIMSSKLKTVYSNYQKIQDEYSRIYISLINLNAILKKIENNLWNNNQDSILSEALEVIEKELDIEYNKNLIANIQFNINPAFENNSKAKFI
ncbi:MAG: serine/threonine-protein kinase [bacterium]